MPRRNYSKDRPRPHTYNGDALRRLAEEMTRAAHYRKESSR